MRGAAPHLDQEEQVDVLALRGLAPGVALDAAAGDEVDTHVE